jgi:hypothetical protein
LLHSLPADLEHTQVALKLEVMVAQAMIASKGYSSPETMEVLLRAKKLITEATETSQRFTILYGMWACYYVGGEVNKQHAAATEFLSEAETHDDTAPSASRIGHSARPTLQWVNSPRRGSSSNGLEDFTIPTTTFGSDFNMAKISGRRRYVTCLGRYGI